MIFILYEFNKLKSIKINEVFKNRAIFLKKIKGKNYRNKLSFIVLRIHDIYI